MHINFRFVILALVPRDLLHQLPVPKRIRTYLDTPFYYSETIADWAVPGNEPVSSNLSKDDGGIESLLQTFSGQPPFSSLSEEDRLLPSNLETQTQTDTTQTYQMEEARNTSANEVMGDAIMPELSSATVSSHTTTTLQSTGSANEESQNPSNDNIEKNDSVQSPIVSDPPSSPLVQPYISHYQALTIPHIFGASDNLEEQEDLVNSENISVRNTCDAPPSNSNFHSSSHQKSSPP